jgi:hypothetical protein
VLSVEIEYTRDDMLPDMVSRLSSVSHYLHTVNLQVLSTALLRLRARMKGEHRTNNLARSLQPGDPQNINEVGDTTAQIGSSRSYAAKVNDGGPIYPIGKMLTIPLTDFLRNPLLEDNWPRDFDPARERLQIMPSDDGLPILFDPEDERLRWLLTPAVNWGEGYHYLEWDKENVADAVRLFYDFMIGGVKRIGLGHEEGDAGGDAGGDAEDASR